MGSLSEILRPEVTVLVPALNEEATISEVIERLRALPLRLQIIVINDGSTDGTAAALAAFGDQIEVLSNPAKSGKGSAIRQALPLARGVATIVQDADLEYFPEEIPALVAPILKGDAAVVFGTRFAHGFPKGMAVPNKIVNKLLSWSVGVLFFRRVTDEATCYKAFRTDVLQGMGLQCRRFEFCPEVTAKAIRMGHKIVELPIRYEPRNKAAGKKIRWTDAPDAFWALFRHRFSRIGPASKSAVEPVKSAPSV